MTGTTTPRIGVLGLLLDAYRPLFPGIQEQQESYLRDVLANLSDVAEFHFPGAATTREEVEAVVHRFNADGLDAVVIVMLSYAPGQHVVRAMLENRLPVALVLIQPEERTRPDIDERALTVNQGIHGSQDVANSLLRAGIPLEVYAGSRTDGRLRRFLQDFGAAAATTRAARHLRLGAIGALTGMGDIIVDEMALFRNIGPQVSHDAVGEVFHRCEAVSEEAVRERVARDRELFDIDPRLPAEDHAYAVRLYLGLRAYLDDHGYAGFTAHYEDFGADGRFRQLPLLAASHLLADGYGYAAEGDVMAAALVTIMGRLVGEANFTEMYMFDLERDAILFCHAGEGNWATAGDRPRIIDRVLTEGGLGNPPTPLFTPRSGRATIASLVHLGEDRFRLVSASGEVLAPVPLPNCDMPSFFFRPDAGAAGLAAGWLRAGGAHHQAVVLGEHDARIATWCRLNRIEQLQL